MDMVLRYGVYLSNSMWLEVLLAGHMLHCQFFVSAVVHLHYAACLVQGKPLRTLPTARDVQLHLLLHVPVLLAKVHHVCSAHTHTVCSKFKG